MKKISHYTVMGALGILSVTFNACKKELDSMMPAETTTQDEGLREGGTNQDIIFYAFPYQ